MFFEPCLRVTFLLFHAGPFCDSLSWISALVIAAAAAAAEGRGRFSNNCPSDHLSLFPAISLLICYEFWSEK